MCNADEMDDASARPPCLSGNIRSTLMKMLATIAHAATMTGVFVFFIE